MMAKGVTIKLADALDLDLQSAQPIGPETEKYSLWNRIYYWEGEHGGIVKTLIICGQGKMLNPEVIPDCKQKFNVAPLNAYVVVYYRKNLLPHWRAFGEGTRALVLSLTHGHSRYLKAPRTNNRC